MPPSAAPLIVTASPIVIASGADELFISAGVCTFTVNSFSCVLPLLSFTTTFTSYGTAAPGLNDVVVFVVSASFVFQLLADDFL